MNWEFNIGNEVYDKARRQNGMIVARKYQENPNDNEYTYNVCYGGPEKVEYEWGEGYWLTLGHRIE